MQNQSAHKLDLRGLLTPFTLLKVSQTFREIQVGEILEVLWGEPADTAALFKVLPASSYQLISMETVETAVAKAKACRILIKKKSGQAAESGKCGCSSSQLP